jgi:hypothetical protein
MHSAACPLADLDAAWQCRCARHRRDPRIVAGGVNVKHKPILGLLGLLAAFAVLIGVWSLRPGTDASPESTLALQVAADCDSARQSCRARGDDLEIELRLGPPVLPMEAFDIQLQSMRGDLGTQARIDVQFQMRGMDMGLNRYRLDRDADGVWRGRALLPVCASGRSDWYVVIDIAQDGRRWVAEIPFVVGQQ